MITRMELWHKPPQFLELASKKWKRSDPGTEDRTENKQDDKTTDDQFENDHQSSLWRCCTEPPPQAKKALLPACQRVESAFGQTSALPLSRHIWNKANFPFHQSGLFIPFWVASSQTPHLSVTKLLYLSKLVFFLHPNVRLASYIHWGKNDIIIYNSDNNNSYHL